MKNILLFMFLSVGILCESQFVLARVSPLTLKFPVKDKIYTYNAMVGSLNKKEDPIIIENDRLYVKYDGPQLFFREVSNEFGGVGVQEVPNEFYEKFIYVGKVKKMEDKLVKKSYYHYIDDPDSPAFKLITLDYDGNRPIVDVVYEDTPPGTKITGITFFRDLPERDAQRMPPTEQLEKLRKYEREYFDAHDPEIKKIKLDSEIEKTRQEIEKLQKQLDELQKERKTCK